jgi:methyl halide transferase
MSSDPVPFESLRLSTDPNDPLAPQYDWSARYAEAHTPWDLGGPHPGLVEWWEDNAFDPDLDLDADTAIVPGCGKGHDVLHIARQGVTVTAIDIVDSCAEFFIEELTGRSGRFHVANFLKFGEADTDLAAFGGPWDFLFEHTIFCAIEPEQRAAFGRAAARCVRPGGYLLSFLFPIDKPLADGGPPHRAEPEQLIAALGEAFELVERGPSEVHEPGQRNWREERLLLRRV